MAKHTILFLAANPLGTDRLRLDEEARAIQEELERSGHRDQFELVTRWAARPIDLLRELRRLKPTVLHFSGHGGVEQTASIAGTRRDIAGAEGSGDRDLVEDRRPGLFFEGPDGRPQLVSTAALEKTLGAAGSSVRLIVLSACYSGVQAEALVTGVDCVVGMGGSILDQAARSFAVGFYGGLAGGESVAAAFQQGCAAIQLEGLPDAEKPQMKSRDGIDVTRLVLPEPEEKSIVHGGLRGILRYLLAALVALALFSIYAAWRSARPVLEQVTVAGVVVDENNAPIKGASITAEGRDLLAESKDDGAFLGRLSKVTPGEILEVQVSKRGRQRSVHTVTVHDRAVNLFTIVLMPAPRE